MESFDIYAEISKKQLRNEKKGESFVLPNGVTLSRKSNSRALYFHCEDKNSQKALIEILDNNHINWQ